MRYQKFAKEKHSSLQAAMSHLIRFDGGQEYCTYCGTNDFSTACNHDINDNNEIVLRERQLLKKENDLIIKERMLSIKMTELAIKEQDLIVTRQAIQFSYATIILWFLMLNALTFIGNLYSIRRISRYNRCHEEGYRCVYRSVQENLD